MIDTKALPARQSVHHVAASDAHADVQAAIDILDSLRLAGKLSYDDFKNLRYFLVSAQYGMEEVMEGGAIQVE